MSIAGISIVTAACPEGGVLPLAPGTPAGMAAHITRQRPLPVLRAGTELRDAPDGRPLFRVTGRALLPLRDGPHAWPCPLLTALAPHHGDGSPRAFFPARRGRSLAWITLSDKGAAGQRDDTGGPAIERMVRERLPLCHAQGFLLPDDAPSLRALLVELALGQGYDLICTTGGTGLGPRDVTPEATLAVLERRLPGFEQAMTAAGLSTTPHAAISRAVAGTLGLSVIINLPGSRKAVLENLAAVLPALPHALDKLHGDPADCGG